MREKSRLKLLGFLLAWAMVFAACVSFAQPTVTRGGALKKRAYQTYATTTLYVDPTGNDANPCTASGTSACATLTGALEKLPRNINHTVTIDVAAGTYTESPVIGPLTFGGTSSGMTISGPTGAAGWAAVAPTTGTATGTLTAYTAMDNLTATLGTATDSTQSWTVNDLRGAYLTVTSGAANGLQGVIVGNTATELNVNRTFTGLAAGATYSIQRPSAIISGALTVRGVGGHATASTGVLISDLQVIAGASAAVTVQNVTLASTTLSTVSGVVLRRLYTTSTGSSALRCFDGAVGTSSNTTFGLSTSPASSTVTAQRCSLLDFGGVWVGTGTTAVTGALFATRITGLGSVSTIPVYVGASAQPALQLNASVGVSPTTLRVENTGSGLGLWLSNSSTLPMTYGVAVTSTTGIGIRLGMGSRLSPYQTSYFSSSGGGGDISIDDVTYTSAFFTGLSPACIVGSAASSLCTQN